MIAQIPFEDDRLLLWKKRAVRSSLHFFPLSMYFSMTRSANRYKVKNIGIRSIFINVMNFQGRFSKAFAFLQFFGRPFTHFTKWLSGFRIKSAAISVIGIQRARHARKGFLLILSFFWARIGTFKRTVLAFAFIKFKALKFKNAFTVKAFKNIIKSSFVFSLTNYNSFLHAQIIHLLLDDTNI